MAPRRSAATEVVEEEEPHLAVLQFNDALSWRAGRAIPTGDLLKRLETLFRELQELDQGQVDKDSLTKVAKELVGQNLIGHKDKGVRAYTACCLADVLKICAPDAPYTASQLRVCCSRYPIQVNKLNCVRISSPSSLQLFFLPFPILRMRIISSIHTS